MQTFTTEQLMQKYGQTGTPNTPSTASSPTPAPAPTKTSFTTDELKSKYNVTSTASTPAPKPEPEVKGGFLGNLFSGNTQKFGKTIGESLATGKNADLYAETLKGYTDVKNNLVTEIAKRKKEGKDVSNLEKALASHTAAEPKIEDFTGNVINKTPGQVAGEAGGTALEALSGGVLGKGVGTVASKELSVLDKIKSGAKIGATYGGIGGATDALQEGGGVGETLGGTAKGGAIGALLGGGLGAGGALLSKKGANVAEKVAEKFATKADSTTGRILQGLPEDIKGGKEVLSKIDTKGIKTYKDLGTKLDETLTGLHKKQDTLLETNTTKTKLNKLDGSVKVGDTTIKHNYVKDAITQLEDFYTKTNNQVGKFEMKELKKAATKDGLTVKDLNALARKHGRVLNGFNANGELASGLTKQAAENTRSGVKATLREIFGGKESEAIDREITKHIGVRDLVQKQEEAVNKLRQKIQERGIGEKVGRAIFKVINTLGLGSPKGMIEAAIGRGTGLKTLNPLDLEKALNKNLKLLKKLNDKNIPEHTILQLVDEFINQNPQTLLDKLKKK